MHYDLSTFKFWCYKVLPLVYDDSLSYYEVLCKVVDYINKLIEQDKIFGNELVKLKEDLTTVQNWIDNYDTSYAKEVLEKFIANMIYVDISDSGYIIYHIPESWNDAKFYTTGIDITVPTENEYGHLVLSLYENLQGTQEENKWLLEIALVLDTYLNLQTL